MTGVPVDHRTAQLPFAWPTFNAHRYIGSLGCSGESTSLCMMCTSFRPFVRNAQNISQLSSFGGQQKLSKCIANLKKACDHGLLLIELIMLMLAHDLHHIFLKTCPKIQRQAADPMSLLMLPVLNLMSQSSNSVNL